MVRGHDHPSKTGWQNGFHPPFWLLKSCSILISGWQIDQVPEIFFLKSDLLKYFWV
jgi:hypothetical protein